MFLTLFVSAGFLSAGICQYHQDHMPMANAQSHHSTPGEKPDNVEKCCVIQAGEVPATDTIVVGPEAAVDVVMVGTVVANPPAAPLIPRPERIHAPPGKCLLHQICALLI